MSVNKEKVRVYIANILSSLGETDRKIAEFMINQPAKVVQLPVKKLAQELVVSEATIVRFAKKIGYGGLLKLKAALKRELLDDSDLSLPSSPDIFLDDSRNDVAQKLALTIVTTVKETIDLLDMQKIRQLVERFIAARRVMFVGFGASGLSAMEARDKMNRIGIDSEAFTDRFTMTLKLANLKPDDLVVAFSHSGETPEVVNAFRLAQKAGAQRLAITHSPQSPLNELAEQFLLTCGSAGPYQGDSIATRISQLFMIEFLCTEIMRHTFQDRASAGLSIKEILIKERIKRESAGE
ncbi:MurR/RpiR family transcriptional regulator [Cronobacter sakazakii]|uniref:MurR/RpiR family transcriptional regulator n=1 Tax=Cronobacter sakazakii TaxID=28141 RepID=UPI00124B4B6E|nr:MurR/RpiR family transcriptional regulator [Cronobacter sakazakii]EKK7703283.1 MurR/RpiR family transcriptional regulator [Cronobacter sakazakii]ELQ6208187.1 MurR/RpiR family transcriptional regulator [Cronobacter sakazakii]ELY6373345.1 MurR/RpiR family transcriptional regulator [Cronobacter sakazakii]ELZ3957086.1 MurR/RpiR family transcriptional regulator [Cronobacter sakazakii]KAB1485224.1 MurR/RpiR family transcriptional regulator [Cronobacter sakazakii]